MVGSLFSLFQIFGSKIFVVKFIGQVFLKRQFGLFVPDEAADVAAVLDHEQNDAKQAQQCRQLAAGGEHERRPGGKLTISSIVSAQSTPLPPRKP